MQIPPAKLASTLITFGQSHVLAGWDSLSPDERSCFVRELQAVNFAELKTLFDKRNDPLTVLPGRERIAPLPVEPGETIPETTREIGEAALRAGKVAALVVAGGQGTRLGFDQPKGMYPIGPVSQSSLFQIHAEKVVNLWATYGPVPLLVMTSPATHDETVTFFREQNHFGLPADDVHFFQQGTMPALDAETGKLLLEAPGKLFLSPNGHGGTLTALADSGLLDTLQQRGIEHVFYFQVDNPLVNVCDPAFVGRHIEARSDASSKVIAKTEPGERVGILAQIDGRCTIIEYSDLPATMAEERTADGQLAFRAGSPAIHCFSMAFLRDVTSGAHRLAFHVARKKVPYWDAESRTTVSPEKENALKFELFIFDALPHADRWLAVEAKREDEFVPLKNATGADSPEVVRQAILDRSRRWLAEAGIDVEFQPSNADHPVEISPRLAINSSQLLGRVPNPLIVSGPIYLTS
jgi:UDP-N-acetylglucosamine/UDP-N-acetylgalactosamine diphosphorylase